MYIESFSSFLIQHRTCALFYPDNNFENIQGDKVSINKYLLTMYILRNHIQLFVLNPMILE